MATGRYFTLNTGSKIPALGLGTWRSSYREVYAAVTAALRHGYRHIDTALIYGNETGAGQAIRNSQIPREQIFLTTKLWNTYHNKVSKGIGDSLKHLGLDYVDLYLMHWPKLIDTGVVKAIGVSNFSTRNLQRLLDAGSTKIVPVANQAPQILRGPIYSRNSLLTGPLQEEPSITEINTSAAQVLISWAIQRGASVIPKSVTPSKIQQNFQDFVLEDADFEELNCLYKDKTVRVVVPQWGVKVFDNDDN
ncbi:NADP-dependent oxidoreductase domain-containing protein [Lipomyces chichibuensis]|uniref:NADP-dependent oxidoreductase domain-containing protein n=1 Tax=Lipomyces chichibuensis TaxID=1546026 RepID=UPI00334401C4